MAPSPASGSKAKKPRKVKEFQCIRDLGTWELTEDVSTIPRASPVARKRAPMSAQGSETPKKARRDKQETPINRAVEIWDLTGEVPRQILSPTSTEKRGSIPTQAQAPQLLKEGKLENNTTRFSREKSDDPLPNCRPAASQDRNKPDKSRGRKKTPVLQVHKPVPLRPRPEGVLVPSMAALDPLQNCNYSNEQGLCPVFSRSMPYSSSMTQPNQSPCRGRLENSYRYQQNITGATCGNQRVREDIVMPGESIASTPMWPHQFANGSGDRNCQGNQASLPPIVRGDPRSTNAYTSSLPGIPVQVPNFLSSTPSYLWNWIPQESSPRHHPEIDQLSQPQNDVTPSWAAGRPLCLQLSRTEIGQPFKRPQTPTQVGPEETDPAVQDFRHGGSASSWQQLPPRLSPPQSYKPYTQQYIPPKPLDNLTSFVKSIRHGFNMWPSLRLSQIRKKEFLSSCKNRVLLKLISRYLLEHALDQIARHDPSSELEPKWLMTPWNLYMKGARELLPENDCEQGFHCSCKPEEERNSSRTYGVSCSDERCENRAMNIECVPGKCGAGRSCQNVRLQRQRFPFVVLQKFPGKGFGLIAREIIRPGTMIGEYLGEVLTVEAFEKRVRSYQGEHDFYFMGLTSKLVIDASRKAGITRFINHSCDPNCTAEKWNARGEPHVVIVAKREIKQDEEITFSYQAQSLGTKTKCKCGSAKCKGWLTPTSVSGKDCSEIISSEWERIVKKKIKRAHADIMLAERILQKLYPSNRAQA